MNPEKPRGLIDRVVQKRYCRTGRIESLDPKAFRPRAGENELSFSDRAQRTPEEALAAYNRNPDAPEAIQGKWTAAIRAAQAEKIICVADVILDDPENDPAHVAVVLDKNRTTDDEDAMCTKMVYLAREHGLFH